MKKPIIYSYIPIDTTLKTCTVYLLVPPGEYITGLSQDRVPAWTDLQGIGPYGYKTFSSYETYKVPGVHRYYSIHQMAQGVLHDSALKRYVNLNFKNIPGPSPDPTKIVYGFTGKGRVLIEKATIYALVPRAYFKYSGPQEPGFPRNLRLFDSLELPEPEDAQKYYIIKIPGITRCTFLELYEEGKEAVECFEKTLERI